MSDLYTVNGQRKYLNQTERDAFLSAAKTFPENVESFCNLLAVSGCRISEALELIPNRIDQKESLFVFETLKKRKKGIYRAVPASPTVLTMLVQVHKLRSNRNKTKPLWSWSRQHAWRLVKAVMEKAGIEGAQATAKGLRHSYGVLAIQKGIPLNVLQKWLGHADIKTTAIYAEAVGAEEKELAARMWQ